MQSNLFFYGCLVVAVSQAYWVPLQREIDPLQPETNYRENFPLEYDSALQFPSGAAGYVVQVPQMIDGQEETPWVKAPLAYEAPQYGGDTQDEQDLGPINLSEIEEQLSTSLDAMTPMELDEFSDWLVTEGNEKYLETFLAILESQLVSQYNQDVSEEQEIVDVLTDIEMLESEIHKNEDELEVAPYPYPGAPAEENYLQDNYNYNYYDDDWASPLAGTYWVYQQPQPLPQPQPQPAFQLVEPVAMQNMPSRAAFLAREVEPEMKRFVLV